MEHFGELKRPSGLLWCKQSNEQFARIPDKANKSNILANRSIGYRGEVWPQNNWPKVFAEPSRVGRGIGMGIAKVARGEWRSGGFRIQDSG